ESPGDDENISALVIAAILASSLWDSAAFDALTARIVALAREAGTLSLLPDALDMRGHCCAEAGDLAEAAAAYDEAETIRQATGLEPGTGDHGRLSAVSKGEAEVTRVIRQALSAPGIGDVPVAASALLASLAALYNGLGRFPEALAAARSSAEQHSAG